MFSPCGSEQDIPGLEGDPDPGDEKGPFPTGHDIHLILKMRLLPVFAFRLIQLDRQGPMLKERLEQLFRFAQSSQCLCQGDMRVVHDG